jgi:hypothetical protein
MKMIKDENTIATKKAVKKFSNVEISPTNNTIRGSFKIKNFRKYSTHSEVDIEFVGEIFAKTSIYESKRWYSSEIYSKKGISKIKVNKLIKRHLFKEVKSHALYFGIDIKWIENIKKVTWK